LKQKPKTRHFQCHVRQNNLEQFQNLQVPKMIR
jgi:hypothetical protein